MITDATLQLDREMQWTNPDPPYAQYRFPFHVRANAWPELQSRLRDLAADRFILITDDSFPAHLAAQVKQQIQAVADCELLTFGGGERAKNLVTVQRLGDRALQAGATRASVFIALGGGLVGNVTGLLAGLFCRGSRFVHVPTTLLAASDSCLSLKQGVNSQVGKNHYGLFHAPVFVWSDLAFFETLPTLEIRAALNECIKNILAICPHYRAELKALLRLDALYLPSQFMRIIDLCIEAKSSLMQKDALEKHQAVTLEYGHSIGHALELAAPGKLPHGIAIGLGMVVEATISHLLGLLSDSDLQAHYELLEANGAPVAIPNHPAYTTENLLRLLAHDNKRGYLPATPDTYDMVLLKALGKPARTGNSVISHVHRSDVVAALAACRAAR